MKKILAAILVLILAAFSFAALGESIPTDVSGLWHAYLADGESTLFLRVDGTGSLMVGESAYNVAWSQSGSALILDQGGALVEGVCEEDLISLTIGGGNLVFFRELPEPMPLECDLTGVWRAPLPGGDSTLTLNADGAASMNLGPEAVSLTWTHDGASVTLFQDGYPIDCVFDGVFISIFLGEGSICFIPDAMPAAVAP